MSHHLPNYGSYYTDLAGVFQALAQPVRLRILMALAERETCVCHLEVCLGLRQAYLSQQLTILRQVGLVQHRREGKHIFYSLSTNELPNMLNQISSELNIGKIRPEKVLIFPVSGCPCPDCVNVNEHNHAKETV